MMLGESRVRVVCLGETMLMFAPPRCELIERCDQFTAYSGGSESNVAIGLERLGMHAGWIGRAWAAESNGWSERRGPRA